MYIHIPYKVLTKKYKSFSVCSNNDKIFYYDEMVGHLSNRCFKMNDKVIYNCPTKMVWLKNINDRSNITI